LVVGGAPASERWAASLAIRSPHPIPAFGALALLAAAVGLYSLLAYGVAQRTREIGVRITLGARSAKVVGLVLQEGVLLVLGGVVIGLLIALLAANAVAPCCSRPARPSRWSTAVWQPS
jgi:ABC-type antimicrobial peptide transport system permease subunit